MQVFQQEYDDGVVEQVVKDNSVSFAPVAEPLSVDIASKKMKALEINSTEVYENLSFVDSVWENLHELVIMPK